MATQEEKEERNRKLIIIILVVAAVGALVALLYFEISESIPPTHEATAPYTGTKKVVPAFTDRSHEREGSKEYYRRRRHRGYLHSRTYTSDGIGAYYEYYYNKYPAYAVSRRYRASSRSSYTIRHKRECLNYEAFYVGNSSKVLGKFECPLHVDAAHHTQCCGQVYREYCCSSRGLPQKETFLYVILGVGIVEILLLLRAFYVTKTGKKFFHKLMCKK